jgi:hypothetical protein
MSRKQSSPRALFVVGLQKSGTTLLNRLLSRHDQVTNPFKLEGRDFWGDCPPFSPEQAPCGTLYQAKHALAGHRLTAEDYRAADQKMLAARLAAKNIQTPYWINKNPYNTVRISWLKEHFPDCLVIAMVRDPVANVFSLLKKFHPHEAMGYPPEHGWWGVKPSGWNALVDDDKIHQCAQQWLHTNQQLLADHLLIDRMIPYHRLCAEPTVYLQSILAQGWSFSALLPESGRFTCSDQEYLTGSALLSKNRQYQHSQSFELNQDESTELAPLKALEIQHIRQLCETTWQECLQLDQSTPSLNITGS